MVGAMRLATVGVSDMQQALSLFRDIMRLKIERRGPVPPALLKAWRLPAGTSAHMAELSCKGYPVGRLRLVEYDPTPNQRVRLDFGSVNPDSAMDVGPKALDFYVADPILPSVRKIEAAGYKFRSRPVKHQIGQTISEECLFSGPDGVPILIMVGHRHAPTSLRAGSPDGPFSEIPTISVVAGDLAKTRAFYEGVLGLVAVADAETGDAYRDLVNDLTGTPKGTRIHFLLYAQKGEASGKILLVHFFERTGRRLTGRMKPGHLGFSLLTHDTDDINALYTQLRAIGAEIVTPPTQIEGDGAPYRMMLAKGPNEELFEFVQAGAGPVAAAARTARPKRTVQKAAAKAKPKAKAKVKAKAKAKAKAKPKRAAAKKAVSKVKARAKAKRPATRKKARGKK
jgi:catechol 2,3-dioxygenase-like lactoylglutathione lyase family enzyme